MNDKTSIAADYVALHKDSDLENWTPFNKSKTEKLETIYNNLINDVYGEGRELEPGRYEIEIGSLESKTGAPILFEFNQSSEKIQWQVGFDSDSKPAFGLDMFDSESKAQEHAEALSNRGEEGITLTKFIDTAPMQTWKLKDDEWV